MFQAKSTPMWDMWIIEDRLVWPYIRLKELMKVCKERPLRQIWRSSSSTDRISLSARFLVIIRTKRGATAVRRGQWPLNQQLYLLQDFRLTTREVLVGALTVPIRRPTEIKDCRAHNQTSLFEEVVELLTKAIWLHKKLCKSNLQEVPRN